MKKILALLFLSTIANSASAESIHLVNINGKFYLMGKNCRKYEILDANSIKCTNKKGDHSYVARGLTAEQAQPIVNEMAAKQAQNARDIQQLTESVQQFGSSAQGWSRQFTQQAQQYRVPQVGPIGPYGGGVTYTIAGDTLLGSNGVTYRRVGQSVVGSDGTTCQIVSQTIICR